MLVDCVYAFSIDLLNPRMIMVGACMSLHGFSNEKLRRHLESIRNKQLKYSGNWMSIMSIWKATSIATDSFDTHSYIWIHKMLIWNWLNWIWCIFVMFLPHVCGIAVCTLNLPHNLLCIKIKRLLSNKCTQIMNISLPIDERNSVKNGEVAQFHPKTFIHINKILLFEWPKSECTSLLTTNGNGPLVFQCESHNTAVNICWKAKLNEWLILDHFFCSRGKLWTKLTL